MAGARGPVAVVTAGDADRRYAHQGGSSPSSAGSTPTPPPLRRERAPRVCELRARRVLEELGYLHQDLDKVRHQQALYEEEQLRNEAREAALAARAEARRAHERLRVEAATVIQAHLRRLLVIRRILPAAQAAQRERLLLAGRVELADTLQDLRRTMHGLHFLDEHRVVAATRVQAWWRRVLAARVVAVLIFRRQVVKTYRRMEMSAVKIQALFRGARAREGCTGLRREREARRQKVLKEENDRLIRMVVRIQAAARTLFAVREAKRRRLQVAKERRVSVTNPEEFTALRRHSRRGSLEPAVRLGVFGAPRRGSNEQPQPQLQPPPAPRKQTTAAARGQQAQPRLGPGGGGGGAARHTISVSAHRSRMNKALQATAAH